jgi:hypothetical protein
MTPVSQMPRRYTIELAAATLLYVIALFGRAYALKQVGDPALVKAITISPILPVWLCALAVYRFYRGVDEYQRLRLLKMFALTAGLTMPIVASWTFLWDAGAPPLSGYAVVGMMAGIWLFASVMWKVDSAGDDGIPFKRLALAAIAAGIISSGYRFVAIPQCWPAIPFALLVSVLAFVIFIALQARSKS